jgi:ubiquinone/menaquinone biosynthesis C-methylase UbiE
MTGRRRPGPPARRWADRGADRDSYAGRFDAWASTYDHSILQPCLFAPVHQAALRLARRHAPRPRRVLDVGCGTARLLRRARQDDHTAVMVGVDAVWGMVATAASATPAGAAIHYLRATAERLPLADETFDLVFATMSMRHWADPSAGLGEVARVLSPGGVLVLADVFPAADAAPLPARLRAAVRGHRPAAACTPGLAAALRTLRLELIDHEWVAWFAVPDVDVITARRHRPRVDRLGHPGIRNSQPQRC